MFMLLSLGHMWGIPAIYVELARVHLLVLGQLFSPTFSLHTHFTTRAWMVYVERLLTSGTHRGDDNFDALLSTFFWLSNARNWLPNCDISQYWFGPGRMILGLKFESFHRVRSLDVNTL